MTKDEALEYLIDNKGASALSRNFIIWLYKQGGVICNPEEREMIDGMTVMADAHGTNPFDKYRRKKDAEQDK